MRAAKTLGYFLGALVAVVALALVSVKLFVDPNDYKNYIVAAVKNATGRDLVLQGDIKLAVFPWIALELGPTTLSNPAGFDGPPLLVFQHAAVRAKLLPLFQKRLAISHIEIDGLDVKLQKTAAGRGNWESSPSQNPAATTSPASGGGLSMQGVPGIKVTRASVSYLQYHVTQLTLETASVNAGVIPVSLHFDATRGVAHEQASVEAHLDVSNPAGRRYRLAAFSVGGQVNLAGIERAMRWTLATPRLDVDLATQVLAVPTFTLAVAGAQMTGTVNGTHIVDAPRLQGSLVLAPLLLREVIPRLGLADPHTTDPHVLSQLSGSTGFGYDASTVRFDDVKVTLDATHVAGRFADDLAAHALTFAFTVDKFDANAYRSPPGTAPAATPAAPDHAAADDAAAPLEANGTLSIGALHVASLDLSNVSLTLAAKDHVTQVFPLLAEVDGGRYSGHLTLDGRTPVANLSLDEHLTGVDMAKLSATEGRHLALSGKGNVSITATARGVGAQAMLRHLNGHLDAYVTQGAVDGIDLPYQLGVAEAFLSRTNSALAQNTHRTPFDALKMSADISNGVATTKDLTMSSQALRITGQGSANLATQGLDFAVLADTLKSIQGVPVQLPVKITGSLADPIVRPDLEALAKGQLKQKVQGLIQDKLQSLFGKP